jgi:8-oxo-dGTP pyrophosphatase MutT (NUDIX family)
MTLLARGCIILSTDSSRIMMQLRAPDRRNNSYWGFWGGGQMNDELPIETITREITEEIGFLPPILKFYPLHKMVSNDASFEYDTFVATVKAEFIPLLNNESNGYAWVNYDRYPQPLHPGAKLVLQSPRIISKIKTIVEQK